MRTRRLFGPSRRSLIQGSAALALAGVAANAGVVLASEGETTYVPGTYTAAADGISSQVSVNQDTGVSPEGVTEEYVTNGGGQFHYNTTMVELIQDEDGKVLGVYATNVDGEYVRINAEKGVIMATGGYACNREMMKALQPQAAKVIAGERAPITNKGEGIKACMWAGAAKDERGACMLFERAVVPLGTTDPVQALEDGVFQTFWMGSQPWLTVDLNGERFCNESGPYDYRLHSIANKGGMMVEIIPGNAYEHNIAYDTDGCSRSAAKFCWDGETEYATEDGTQRRIETTVRSLCLK